MGLTADRLRELLDYDPATGVFTRRVLPTTMGRHRLGEVAGCLNTNSRLGYWVISIDNRRYLAHRLAWLHVHGRWPKADTDHVNGIRHDNRLANLREATRSQNMSNAKRPRSSGLRGAHYRPDLGKWAARMRHEGRQYNIGLFPSPEEAHAAYCAKARELRGEYVRLD